MGNPAGNAVQNGAKLVFRNLPCLEKSGQGGDFPHHPLRRPFPDEDVLVEQPVAEAVYPLFHVEDVGLAVFKLHLLVQEVLYTPSAVMQPGLVVPAQPEVVAVAKIIMDSQLMLAEKVKLRQEEIPVPHARKVSYRDVLAAGKRIYVVLKDCKEFLVPHLSLVLLEEEVVADGRIEVVDVALHAVPVPPYKLHAPLHGGLLPPALDTGVTVGDEVPRIVRFEDVYDCMMNDTVGIEGKDVNHPPLGLEYDPALIFRCMESPVHDGLPCQRKAFRRVKFETPNLGLPGLPFLRRKTGKLEVFLGDERLPKI